MSVETDEMTADAAEEPKLTGHSLEGSLRCPCGAVIMIPIAGLSNGGFQIPGAVKPQADAFMGAHSHLS